MVPLDPEVSSLRGTLKSVPTVQLSPATELHSSLTQENSCPPQLQRELNESGK